MSRPAARAASLRHLLLLGALLSAGCAGTEAPEATPWEIDAADLRPVGGVVTLRGEPLAGAVVAFFAPSGVASVGETGADGRYTIQSSNRDGALPGEYKVAISYYLSPDGKPQGLGARSAMVQSEAMIAARETLPPEYSDLNMTKLRATVGNEGGQFDFDIDADPKTPEKPDAEPVKAEGERPDGASPPDRGGASDQGESAPGPGTP